VPALTTVSAASTLPFAIESGEGAVLYDAEGTAYWDFYGGHSVALLGQGHPSWVAAITEQAKTLSFVTTIAPSSVRDRAVDTLCRFTRMDRAFLVNSGAEANEAALKVARKATGRTTIIAMERGFHGRTMACLGVTESGHYRTDHSPIHGDTRFVPHGDLNALHKALDRTVAAVIVEPIQGIGGVHEGPEGYLGDVRALCDSVGAALILDEVQTGIGRTGEAMAWHREPACKPDLVTVGKSLGAGFPVAGLLLTEAMAATTKPGEHGSTFGSGPMACAAILAVIDTIEAEDLLERGGALEARLRERLDPVEAVVTVRGRGCLLGVVLDRPARPVSQKLLAAGFLTGGANDPNCIRLCPPAILPPDAIDLFADALVAALETD
jgi:acetylornithine/N-succinyldiaminopimelate aminotransferase